MEKGRLYGNNARICRVLPTHRIPAESHVRLKSSTMTEALSYGRLSPYTSEGRSLALYLIFLNEVLKIILSSL